MSTCDTSNEFDGRIGLRISSIFVIGLGAALGAWFPVFASRHKGAGVPEWAFFIAKYFGSGVIVATAFIHLLAPAQEALGDECLTGPITEYPWVEAISLMTIFVLFFVELLVTRYAKFGGDHSHDEEDGQSSTGSHNGMDKTYSDNPQIPMSQRRTSSHVPGDDHLSHQKSHTDNEAVKSAWSTPLPRNLDRKPTNNDHDINTPLGQPESYSAQLTAVFILEFGVIFHSVFIGLTLAVAGEEFTTLYIVLVFHQSFEGLALGTRLAAVPWDNSKRWTPYLLGAGYAISTPIAIAIGLGVRQSYPPGSETTLITNGVFDSISAGILIYTGLVELMAHEFMFSGYMQRAPMREILAAFGVMCLGAGLMALLGKWA